MNLIRLFLTMNLLVISGSSSALFMPADFQVNSGEAVEQNDASDGDC